MFLSVLITLGLMFTRYYEYFISDLINPEKGFWWEGFPLLAKIFVLISLKTLLLAGVINGFRQQKFAFSKLFVACSSVFFLWEVLNNFGSIHYKRLFNLKDYLSYVENNPSRPQAVSMDKIKLLSLELVKAIQVKDEAIFEDHAPYTVEEYLIEVLVGKEKLEDTEAYDALINSIQTVLKNIDAYKKDYKGFISKFLDEKQFKKLFEELVSPPKFWHKIPEIYQEEIILDGWFPSLKNYLANSSTASLEVFDLPQQLNEKYLHIAHLLKNQFDRYTVKNHVISFEDQAVANEYHQALEDIHRLEKAIEIKDETIDKEAQERREAAIKKLGREKVEEIENTLNSL
ncbi:hypothetical protein [Candidatus Odyssella acanthamoebae]|nr:hypothetical protein [Candidatus Paracaedibacter acanthamoebae]